MPLLHSLCAASSSATAAQLATKPSLLNPTPIGSTKLEFPLPVPDIPADVKQKILSLEVMGIDSGRCLSLNPALRSAPLDSVHATISFLLSKGIRHKARARILGMCPGVLAASVGTDLIPVFAFLARDLGVPAAHFRRVVNKCPRLLACSVRDQLRPALLFLRRLGFTDAAAIAYHDPVLLVSSVERTLMPKLEFLQVGLGMKREEAVGMVLRCPGLFTFSIEKNFKPKFEYLVGEMGGSVEEIKEFPQYFAFSLEKRIKPRNEEMRRGVRLPLPVMLKSTDEEFKKLTEKNGKVVDSLDRIVKHVRIDV